MEKNIIAAMDNNRVIGINNELPWDLPSDLKRFQKLTKGFPCIMGKLTYLSILAKIHKPLPGRKNIVVSSTMSGPQPENVYVVSTLAEAIALAESFGLEKMFFIGGERIFDEALKIADNIFLTKVVGTHEGDAFFPKIHYKEWEEVSREPHLEKEEKNTDGFIFIDYKRATK